MGFRSRFRGLRTNEPRATQVKRNLQELEPVESLHDCDSLGFMKAFLQTFPLDFQVSWLSQVN